MRRLMVVLPVVFGCNDDLADGPPGVVADYSEVVEVAIEPAAGPAPLEVTVRALNAWGAAVPSTPRTVSVEGVDQLVNFDATGHAGLLMAEPGTWSVAAGGDPVDIHVFASDWTGLSMLPAAAAPLAADHVWGVTGGALVQSGARLYYVGADGVPTLVLSTEGRFPLEGVAVGHLDSDGVLDAVVYGGNLVVLLEGRGEGGLSWGGAFESDHAIALGAAVGDLNADGVQDLAIVWDGDDGRTRVEFLHGDGLWHFDSTAVLQLDDRPTGGIVIGDNVGSGLPQVTAMLPTGKWQRFTRTQSDAYVLTGPSIITTFAPGHVPLSGDRDLNGDGADELVFIGPEELGAERELWIWDLFGSIPEFIRETPQAPHLVVGDLHGTGLGDVVSLLEDGSIELIWFSGGYHSARAGKLPEIGPLGITDVDTDGTADLLVAGEDLWRWWPGRLQEADWLPVLASIEAWDAAVQGPMANAGAQGVVGFQRDAGATWLSLWRGRDGGLVLVDRVQVSDGTGLPMDVAVCGTKAWALTSSTLSVVNLGATVALERQIATSGDRVDCGVGPQGASGAVLAGGTVALYDAALGQVGTEDATGMFDLAIARRGGSPAIATCDVPSCSVVSWAWGSSDERAVAATTYDGVHLELEDGSTLDVAGGGQLSVGDVDADGNLDLIAARSGTVSVWRSTGQGIAPGRVWHSRQALVGAMIPSDVDGDGMPELWSAREDTDIVWFAPR